MEIKDVAKKRILEMEHIIERINEAEELLIALKAPSLNNRGELMNDVSIGIPTHYMGNGFFPEERRDRFYTVQLESDLGITGIQSEIRKLVADATIVRIDAFKEELEKLIYYTNDRHE